MKHFYLLCFLVIVSQFSCTNRLPESTKEQKEIGLLHSKLIKAYRDNFEKLEYPKLNDFQKQGYDWYWSHMWESSGMFTATERKRILKESGENAMKSWDSGWTAALEINERAVK